MTAGPVLEFNEEGVYLSQNVKAPASFLLLQSNIVTGMMVASPVMDQLPPCRKTEAQFPILRLRFRGPVRAVASPMMRMIMREVEDGYDEEIPSK